MTSTDIFNYVTRQGSVSTVVKFEIGKFLIGHIPLDEQTEERMAKNIWLFKNAKQEISFLDGEEIVSLKMR